MNRAFEGPWDPSQARVRARGLMIMNAAGSATCLYSGWIQPIPGAPHTVYRVLAVAAAAVSLCLWRSRRPLTWTANHLLLGAYAATVGVMAAVAQREVAIATLGSAVIATTAYAGYFFIGKAFYAHLGWGVGTYCIGAAVGPVTGPAIGILTAITTATGLAVVLNRLTRQLTHHIATDALTGVATREAWLHTAEQVIATSGSGPITVAIIDMDHFKSVNDLNGHIAGDRLLRDVTAAWKLAVDERLHLGRFGGDEFVILLPHTSLHQARAHLRTLAESHPAAWTAGLAQHLPGETIADQLHRADLDLIQAKSTRT